jgi:tetratricopeptide (TPR) repeat protein
MPNITDIWSRKMRLKSVLSVALIIGTMGMNCEAFAQTHIRENTIIGQTSTPSTSGSFPDMRILSNVKLLECLNTPEHKTHRESLRYFNRELRKSPNNSCLYFGRGLAYMNMGKHQSAKIDFDTFIGMEPNFSYVYVLRGLCFMALNSPVTALADLKKSARLFELEGNSEFLELINGLIKNLELLLP